jgi:hypothetical protein
MHAPVFYGGVANIAPLFAASAIVVFLTCLCIRINEETRE